MKRKRTRIIVIILALIAVAVIGGKVFLSRVEANLAALAGMPVAGIDLDALEDGDYSGSYSVFPVTAEVRVTVRDHAIADIELVKHVNGQGSGAEAVIGKVLEAQSLDVDAVSGATYSSKVILKAIEDAL